MKRDRDVAPQVWMCLNEVNAHLPDLTKDCSYLNYTLKLVFSAPTLFDGFE